MNQRYLFILILLTASASAALGSSKVSPATQKIANHFWPLLKSAVAKYKETLVEGSPFGIHNRYETQSGEHIIDIAVNCEAETPQGCKAKLSFFNAKKADVFKQMGVFNPAELEIQAAAFEPFVLEMATLTREDSFNKKLYFNMIEDVRDQLLTIGDKKKLKFRENSQGEQLTDKLVRLELSYEENLLGIFTIAPLVADKKHVLRVSFVLSKNLGAETGSVDIPVITKEENALGLRLKEVLTKLQLKDHVNCNFDNMSNLKRLSPEFGKLVTFSLPDGSTPKLQKFILKSADDIAFGAISYTEPKPNSQEVGKYSLEVTMNGEKVREAAFERMTVKEFEDFIRKLDLGALFHSLWAKIQVVFKEELKQFHAAEESAFQNSEKGKIMGLIGHEKFFLETIVRKQAHSTLGFKEAAGNVELSLKTHLPALSELTLTFVRNNYRIEVVRTFFRNALAMIEAQKSKPNEPASQLKKLRA